VLPCLTHCNTNKLVKKLNPDFLNIFCELNWDANLNGCELNWEITAIVNYCRLMVHITDAIIDTRAQKWLAIQQCALQNRCLHMTNIEKSLHMTNI